MTEQAPVTLSRTDRIVKRIARYSVWWLYRSVDVYRAENTPTTGPVLAVSNHFGGFSDALLLVHVLHRVPRILARDKIWQMPLVRTVMNWIGAIPVHKPEDHARFSSNDQMFGSAYRALDAGEQLLIFPEGITVDDPSIASIKTGAARIALGAAAKGTGRIQIVPAGIHYEDKAALRRRVFVNVGTPLDIDSYLATEYGDVGATAAEDRRLVRALTDDIEDRLRRVAPDFADWGEARHLTHAAAIAVRASQDDPHREVHASDRDRLAGDLARANNPDKEAVIEAVTEFDQRLDAIGLTDAQAYERLSAGRFLRYAIRIVLIGLVLLPFALIGISLNIVPLLAIGALSLLRVSPAVKATLKPLAAMFLFPIAWALAAWRIVYETSGPLLTLVSVIFIPVYLLAAVLLSERIVLLWRTFRDWRSSRRLAAVQEEIVAGRESVIDLVKAATT